MLKIAQNWCQLLLHRMKSVFGHNGVCRLWRSIASAGRLQMVCSSWPSMMLLCLLFSSPSNTMHIIDNYLFYLQGQSFATGSCIWQQPRPITIKSTTSLLSCTVMMKGGMIGVLGLAFYSKVQPAVQVSWTNSVLDSFPLKQLPTFWYIQ